MIFNFKHGIPFFPRLVHDFQKSVQYLGKSQKNYFFTIKNYKLKPNVSRKNTWNWCKNFWKKLKTKKDGLRKCDAKITPKKKFKKIPKRLKIQSKKQIQFIFYSIEKVLPSTYQAIISTFFPGFKIFPLF